MKNGFNMHYTKGDTAMTYQENDRIEYFFKGDEDNEPCQDVILVKKMRNVAEGEFIKLKPTASNKSVFQRGEFNRSLNKFLAIGYTSDTVKAVDGDTLVFTNFIF